MSDETETAGDRLKKARLAAGFTSAMGAAKYFQWKPSTYASHENGSAQIRPFWAELYGQAFRVPPRWILSGQDESAEVMPPKGTKMSSLARSPTTNIFPIAPPPAQAGGLGAAAYLRSGMTMLNVYGWRRNDQNEIVTDFSRLNDSIAAPPNLLGVEGAYAALVADNSMSPRVRPGDTIFVNPTKPPRPGDLVMIVPNDDRKGKIGILREFVGQDFLEVIVKKEGGENQECDYAAYEFHRVVGVLFD